MKTQRNSEILDSQLINQDSVSKCCDIANKTIIFRIIIIAVFFILLFVVLTWLYLNRVKVEKNSVTNITNTVPKNSPMTKEKVLGIGFGFSRKNEDLVKKLTEKNDFIDTMVGPGDATLLKNIEQKYPVQVSCVFRSLSQEQETIKIARESDFKCHYLGYNPEQSEKTPKEELDDFLGSVKKAKQLSDEYGAEFLLGPGLKYMTEMEENYPKAAPYADVWLIQSQAFEISKDGKKNTPEQYKSGVKRIVDLIHQGNPDTKIWVQIIISPGSKPKNTFTKEEIIAFIESIKNTADSVRLYLTQVPQDEVVQKQVIEYYRQ